MSGTSCNRLFIQSWFFLRIRFIVCVIDEKAEQEFRLIYSLKHFVSVVWSVSIFWFSWLCVEALVDSYFYYIKLGIS